MFTLNLCQSLLEAMLSSMNTLSEDCPWENNWILAKAWGGKNAQTLLVWESKGTTPLAISGNAERLPVYDLVFPAYMDVPQRNVYAIFTQIKEVLCLLMQIHKPIDKNIPSPWKRLGNRHELFLMPILSKTDIGIIYLCIYLCINI